MQRGGGMKNEPEIVRLRREVNELVSMVLDLMDVIDQIIIASKPQIRTSPKLLQHLRGAHQAGAELIKMRRS
jgi:hypothetical protein